MNKQRLKITFLGTSAGWPLPRLGCGCEICSSKDRRDRRLRPSILVTFPVETGHPTTLKLRRTSAPSLQKTTNILIDPGPDLYHQLNRLPRDTAQNISHCLITHAHPDHVLGLSDFDHIYNKRQRIKLIAPDAVFKDLQRNFRNLYQNLRNFEIVRTSEVRVGPACRGGGDCAINFIPVPHSKAVKTFGISCQPERNSNQQLSTNNQQLPRIFYAPDIAKLTLETIEIIKHSRLAILDGSSWDKAGQTTTHISICDILNSLSLRGGLRRTSEDDAALPRRQAGIPSERPGHTPSIYLTHLGHKTLPHRKMLEKLKPYSKIIPAYDGLTLEM